MSADTSPSGEAVPEPVIEEYALGDVVSHDVYGLGHVVLSETAAVTVDFRSARVRVASPFAKMAKLSRSTNEPPSVRMLS